MEQIYNPYLPLTEYVPDGEPHVFGDRVYVYGSHDKAEGTVYCEQDYVTWSAPIDNLKDWQYEGVIYRKNQDPSNADGRMQLWAPDVTKGPDGRYYLYYCFSFYPEIGVAVSDSPAGPFAFYGHVKYPSNLHDGAVLREYMPFDPAVLTDDDGRVYLYYGFAPACEKEMRLPELSRDELNAMPDDLRIQYEEARRIQFGENGMVVELEQDMITMKGEPAVSIPGGHHTEGTGFEGHGFFEASSIRKINEKYYFVYSSHKSHELCYAVSDHPAMGFEYGGVIVSNGDIGFNGRTIPVNVLGNNHGGIEKIGENYYIFYHRQTNGTEFSRQGCAERIEISEDGRIEQVEITSCGLNGGPLKASGIYPAAIACHITCPQTLNEIDYTNPSMQQQTRIVQKQNVPYITAVGTGSVLGYKYIEGADIGGIQLEVRGIFKGDILVSKDEKGKNVIGKKNVGINSGDWEIIQFTCNVSLEKSPIYFHFSGEGMLEMKSFGFIQ